MGFFDKLFNSMTSEKESTGNNPAQSAQNAAPAAVPDEPQDMELRFGNPTPVPYNTEVCGTSVTLGLRYRGIAKVSAADAVKVKSRGGLTALQDKLKEEIIAVGDEAWMRCSAANIPFSRLQTQIPNVEREIKDRLEKEWLDQYGVRLEHMGLVQLSMTEDSLKIYKDIMRAQMN